MKLRTIYPDVTTALLPTEIPFEGRHVPHIVIEVNQKCNISCRACYKDKQNITKPLEEVLKEIDLAIEKRNISLITLAGGEPILHPQLSEIIRYGCSKGVQMQFLSNGYALTDEKLQEYKKAGLKEVFLHIDRGQRRPDIRPVQAERELNDLRLKILERISRNGIVPSLVATLYKDTLKDLPDLIEFALQNPYSVRFLLTCCTDFEKLEPHFADEEILGETFELQISDSPVPSQEKLKNQEVHIQEVKAVLKNIFGMAPFGFIPSNRDARDERWLMYHSFSIQLADGSFRYLHLAPVFGKLVRGKIEATKKKGEKISFGKIMNTAKCIQLCLAYAVFSKNPEILFSTLSFLRHLLKPGAKIRYKDFTVQQPPTLSADGKLEYCKDCPDATIRNGVMMPVCMVDYLSPAQRIH